MSGIRNSPPQPRRGGRDIKKDIAKRPLIGADGVVLVESLKILFGSTTPAFGHPSSVEEGSLIARSQP